MKNTNELVTLANQYVSELPAMPPALPEPQGAALAGWIDHTLLRPDATAEQVGKLCMEARQYRFATVCVNPGYVKLAAGILAGSGVGVCTVAAFPLGATLPEMKALETRKSAEWGAKEIDMVINIGAMKGASYPLVLEEIHAVVEAAHQAGAQVKVILEMAYLTRFEKILGCLMCREAGAEFVKTSTGFAPSGATAEDVSLMRAVVGDAMGVKAAGSIRALADAQAMIRAGASRLGASASVAIMRELGQ